MRQLNIFYDDFYIKELTDVKILSIFRKDDLNCLVVDKNLYYPHGGGQKGDRGTIIAEESKFTICNTVRDKATGEAILITDQPLPENLINKLTTCKLDWEFRYSQMRLHTSVHLHHCMLEKVLGQTLTPPVTSDIQDKFAFNRYEKLGILVHEKLVEEATKQMVNLINQGVNVETYPDPEKPGFRWWKCLEWTIPCGGTHVANVKEIGKIDVSFSTKRGMPTVNFKLVPE